MSPVLLLTHGAGSNREAPLLLAVDREFTKLGWLVERVDLAFRLSGKPGPPRGADQAKDREGLAEHLTRLRSGHAGPVYFGGHSYGGRQGSMLMSERPELADALLLLSYPLHPPGKPEQLRTAHFEALRLPALFVSGSKDEFGTVEEMQAAMRLISNATLISLDGARHDLKAGRTGVAERVACEFAAFVAKGPA